MSYDRGSAEIESLDRKRPKKVRELKAILLKAGFSYESAKGSHTKWSHPLIIGKLTLSGKDGADAKSYQERDIREALQRIQEGQE